MAITLNDIQTKLKKYGIPDTEVNTGFFEIPTSESKIKSLITIWLPTAYKGKKDSRTNFLIQLEEKFKKDKVPMAFIKPTKDLYKSRSSAGFIAFVDSKYYIEAKILEVKFKPSDIEPSIVNEWLTPEEMIENVKKYAEKEKANMDLAKYNAVNYLLDETIKDTNKKIHFGLDKGIVPAEFYEILTAVKLAVLLRNNDPEIFNIMGILPTTNIKQNFNKVKINIPAEANFPLIDYEIITSTNTSDSYKISVKSKVKSPEGNTVKFKDIFKKPHSVRYWLRDVLKYSGQKMADANKGPATVAFSALELYGLPGGKARVGIPIYSVANIYDGRKPTKNLDIKTWKKNVSLSDLEHFSPKKLQPQLNKIIKSRIKVGNHPITDAQIPDFIQGLKIVHANINKYKSASSLIDGDNPKTSIFDASQTNILVLLKSIIFSNLQQGGAGAKPFLENLAVVCEKILVDLSKESGTPKDQQFNYYQMFYDEVLKKKSVAYAITESSGKGKNTLLHYNFYSKINFKQYEEWIELRSKASDVIGLSV